MPDSPVTGDCRMRSAQLLEERKLESTDVALLYTLNRHTTHLATLLNMGGGYNDDPRASFLRSPGAKTDQNDMETPLSSPARGSAQLSPIRNTESFESVV